MQSFYCSPHIIVLVLTLVLILRDVLVVPLALAHPHAPVPAAPGRPRGPGGGSAPAGRRRQHPGQCRVFSVKLRVTSQCWGRSVRGPGQPRDGGAGVRRGDRQRPVK